MYGKSRTLLGYGMSRQVDDQTFSVVKPVFFFLTVYCGEIRKGSELGRDLFPNLL